MGTGASSGRLELGWNECVARVAAAKVRRAISFLLIINYFMNLLKPLYAAAATFLNDMWDAWKRLKQREEKVLNIYIPVGARHAEVSTNDEREARSSSCMQAKQLGQQKTTNEYDCLPQLQHYLTKPTKRKARRKNNRKRRFFCVFCFCL